MISSCCTFRLKRRSALSIDSPSCTLTSAKPKTPPLRHRQWDLAGPADSGEYVRLSQANADSRRKAHQPSIPLSPTRLLPFALVSPLPAVPDPLPAVLILSLQC